MPYSITTKDGITVNNIPDDVKPDAPELKARVSRARIEAGTRKWQEQIRGDLPGDMSGMEKFRAGAGKAFTDLARGAGQLVGMGPTGAEVKEQRQLDQPLMQTGAGVAGNVAGNIAALAPTAFIPGANTYAGAALIGGGAGLLQPAESGQERLMNAGTGAVVAPAALGATRLVTHGLGAMRAAAEPMTEQGQNKILGALLRKSAGESADDVATRMANAKELIPGSTPTAGQVAESGGVAALERAAAQANPEAYAIQQVKQNAARLEVLRKIAGTEGERAFYAAERDATANQLYKQAFEAGVDITRDPATKQYLAKNVIAGRKGEITKLMQRPAVQEAVKRAKQLAANEGIRLDNPTGSVQGLHYTKTALDDMIEQAGKRGQLNEQRILTALKERVLTTIDALSPEYSAARNVYREMSVPINRMDIGEALLKKMEPALSQNGLPVRLHGDAYARALREGDRLAQQTTGFGKATLENTMSPEQLATLEALRKDLARSANAATLGKGVGSNTFQNLAQEHLLEQAGVKNLPQLLSRPIQITNYLLRSVYGSANEEMKKKLAEALLNPQASAAMMRSGLPGPAVKALAEALKRGESYLPAATTAMERQ